MCGHGNLRFPSCTPRSLLLNNANDVPSVIGLNGVIAQMGERLNGIQEVGSSILPGSTKLNKDLDENTPRSCGAFSFLGNTGVTRSHGGTLPL